MSPPWGVLLLLFTQCGIGMSVNTASNYTWGYKTKTNRVLVMSERRSSVQITAEPGSGVDDLFGDLVSSNGMLNVEFLLSVSKSCEVSTGTSSSSLQSPFGFLPTRICSDSYSSSCSEGKASNTARLTLSDLPTVSNLTSYYLCVTVQSKLDSYPSVYYNTQLIVDVIPKITTTSNFYGGVSYGCRCYLDTCENITNSCPGMNCNDTLSCQHHKEEVLRIAMTINGVDISEIANVRMYPKKSCDASSVDEVVIPESGIVLEDGYYEIPVGAPSGWDGYRMCLGYNGTYNIDIGTVISVSQTIQIGGVSIGPGETSIYVTSTATSIEIVTGVSHPITFYLSLASLSCQATSTTTTTNTLTGKGTVVIPSDGGSDYQLCVSPYGSSVFDVDSNSLLPSIVFPLRLKVISDSFASMVNNLSSGIVTIPTTQNQNSPVVVYSLFAKSFFFTGFGEGCGIGATVHASTLNNTGPTMSSGKYTICVIGVAGETVESSVSLLVLAIESIGGVRASVIPIVAVLPTVLDVVVASDSSTAFNLAVAIFPKGQCGYTATPLELSAAIDIQTVVSFRAKLSVPALSVDTEYDICFSVDYAPYSNGWALSGWGLYAIPITVGNVDFPQPFSFPIAGTRESNVFIPITQPDSEVYGDKIRPVIDPNMMLVRLSKSVGGCLSSDSIALPVTVSGGVASFNVVSTSWIAVEGNRNSRLCISLQGDSIAFHEANIYFLTVVPQILPAQYDSGIVMVIGEKSSISISGTGMDIFTATNRGLGVYCSVVIEGPDGTKASPALLTAKGGNAVASADFDLYSMGYDDGTQLKLSIAIRSLNMQNNIWLPHGEVARQRDLIIEAIRPNLYSDYIYSSLRNSPIIRFIAAEMPITFYMSGVGIHGSDPVVVTITSHGSDCSLESFDISRQGIVSQGSFTLPGVLFQTATRSGSHRICVSTLNDPSGRLYNVGIAVQIVPSPSYFSSNGIILTDNIRSFQSRPDKLSYNAENNPDIRILAGSTPSLDVVFTEVTPMLSVISSDYNIFLMYSATPCHQGVPFKNSPIIKLPKPSAGGISLVGNQVGTASLKFSSSQTLAMRGTWFICLAIGNGTSTSKQIHSGMFHTTLQTIISTTGIQAGGIQAPYSPFKGAAKMESELPSIQLLTVHQYTNPNAYFELLDANNSWGNTLPTNTWSALSLVWIRENDHCTSTLPSASSFLTKVVDSHSHSHYVSNTSDYLFGIVGEMFKICAVVDRQPWYSQNKSVSLASVIDVGFRVIVVAVDSLSNNVVDAANPVRLGVTLRGKPQFDVEFSPESAFRSSNFDSIFRNSQVGFSFVEYSASVTPTVDICSSGLSTQGITVNGTLLSVTFTSSDVGRARYAVCVSVGLYRNPFLTVTPPPAWVLLPTSVYVFPFKYVNGQSAAAPITLFHGLPGYLILCPPDISCSLLEKEFEAKLTLSGMCNLQNNALYSGTQRTSVERGTFINIGVVNSTIGSGNLDLCIRERGTTSAFAVAVITVSVLQITVSGITLNDPTKTLSVTNGTAGPTTIDLFVRSSGQALSPIWFSISLKGSCAEDIGSHADGISTKPVAVNTCSGALVIRKAEYAVAKTFESLVVCLATGLVDNVEPEKHYFQETLLAYAVRNPNSLALRTQPKNSYFELKRLSIDPVIEVLDEEFQPMTAISQTLTIHLKYESCDMTMVDQCLQECELQDKHGSFSNGILLDQGNLTCVEFCEADSLDICSEDSWISDDQNNPPQTGSAVYPDQFVANNASITFSKVPLNGRHRVWYRLRFWTDIQTTGLADLISDPFRVGPCYDWTQGNWTSDRARFNGTRTGAAYYWPSAKYAQPNDTICVLCPEGALCDGTTEVRTEENYWRANHKSYSFYSCLLPIGTEACTENTTTGSCVSGYKTHMFDNTLDNDTITGHDSLADDNPLCSLCASGYGKQGNGQKKCQPCPADWVSWLVAIIGVVVILIALLFMVLSTMKSSRENTKDEFTIMVKMLLTHLSIASLTGSFGNRLGLLLKEILQIEKQASGQVATEMASLDCVLSVNYYDKFIVLMLLPSFFGLLIAFLFGPIMALLKMYFSKKKKGREKLRQLAWFGTRPVKEIEDVKIVDEERERRRTAKVHPVMNKDNNDDPNEMELESIDTEEIGNIEVSEKSVVEREQKNQQLEEIKKRLKIVFDRLDRNNNGTLSRIEIKKGFSTDNDLTQLLKERYGGEENAWQDFWESLDDDNNKEVTWEEFAEELVQYGQTKIEVKMDALQDRKVVDEDELSQIDKHEDELGHKLGFKTSEMKRAYVAAMVIFMVLIYPNLLETAAHFLQCDEYDWGKQNSMDSSITAIKHTRRIFRHDMTLDCDDTIFKRYQLAAIICLLLYGIGIPAGVMSIARLVRGDQEIGTNESKEIRDNRKERLKNSRIMFGFLMAGYAKNRWYWEAVVMLRKCIMVVISVYVRGTFSTYVGMWTMSIFYLLQNRCQPYNHRNLNKLESISILVIIGTLNLSLLYNPETGNFDNNSTDSFERFGFWMLTVVLCVANVALVCYFLYWILWYFLDFIAQIMKDKIELINKAGTSFPTILRIWLVKRCRGEICYIRSEQTGRRQVVDDAFSLMLLDEQRFLGDLRTGLSNVVFLRRYEINESCEIQVSESIEVPSSPLHALRSSIAPQQQQQLVEQDEITIGCRVKRSPEWTQDDDVTVGVVDEYLDFETPSKMLIESDIMGDSGILFSLEVEEYNGMPQWIEESGKDEDESLILYVHGSGHWVISKGYEDSLDSPDILIKSAEFHDDIMPQCTYRWSSKTTIHSPPGGKLGTVIAIDYIEGTCRVHWDTTADKMPLTPNYTYNHPMAHLEAAVVEDGEWQFVTSSDSLQFSLIKVLALIRWKSSQNPTKSTAHGSDERIMCSVKYVSRSTKSDDPYTVGKVIYSESCSLAWPQDERVEGDQDGPLRTCFGIPPDTVPDCSWNEETKMIHGMNAQYEASTTLLSKTGPQKSIEFSYWLPAQPSKPVTIEPLIYSVRNVRRIGNMKIDKTAQCKEPGFQACVKWDIKSGGSGLMEPPAAPKMVKRVFKSQRQHADVLEENEALDDILVEDERIGEDELPEDKEDGCNHIPIIESLEEQLRDVSSALDAKTIQCEDLDQQLLNVEEELLDAQEVSQESSQIKDKITDMHQALVSECTSLTKRIKKETDDTCRKERAYKSHVRELEEQLQIAWESSQLNEEAMSEAQVEVVHLQHVIEDLQKQLNDIVEKYSSLSSQKSDLEQQNFALTERVSDAVKEHQESLDQNQQQMLSNRFGSILNKNTLDRQRQAAAEEQREVQDLLKKMNEEKQRHQVEIQEMKRQNLVEKMKQAEEAAKAKRRQAAEAEEQRKARLLKELFQKVKVKKGANKDRELKMKGWASRAKTQAAKKAVEAAKLEAQRLRSEVEATREEAEKANALAGNLKNEVESASAAAQASRERAEQLQHESNESKMQSQAAKLQVRLAIERCEADARLAKEAQERLRQQEDLAKRQQEEQEARERELQHAAEEALLEEQRRLEVIEPEEEEEEEEEESDESGDTSEVGVGGTSSLAQALAQQRRELEALLGTNDIGRDAVMRKQKKPKKTKVQLLRERQHRMDTILDESTKAHIERHRYRKIPKR